MSTEAFLALPRLLPAAKAHPQVRAVVNRSRSMPQPCAWRAAGLLPWTTEEADAGIAACMGRGAAGNVDTAGEVMRAAREVERKLAAGLRISSSASTKANR
jgi:hypothetical protein